MDAGTAESGESYLVLGIESPPDAARRRTAHLRTRCTCPAGISLGVGGRPGSYPERQPCPGAAGRPVSEQPDRTARGQAADRVFGGRDCSLRTTTIASLRVSAYATKRRTCECRQGLRHEPKSIDGRHATPPVDVVARLTLVARTVNLGRGRVVPYPEPSSSRGHGHRQGQPADRHEVRGSRSAASLHALGLRFRKDMLVRAGKVRSRADIVFTRARLAVYVDGCFWHVCPDHFHMPKSNLGYWEPKLAANVAHNQRVAAAPSRRRGGPSSASGSTLPPWRRPPHVVDRASLSIGHPRAVRHPRSAMSDPAVTPPSVASSSDGPLTRCEAIGLRCGLVAQTRRRCGGWSTDDGPDGSGSPQQRGPWRWPAEDGKLDPDAELERRFPHPRSASSTSSRRRRLPPRAGCLGGECALTVELDEDCRSVSGLVPEWPRRVRTDIREAHPGTRARTHRARHRRDPRTGSRARGPLRGLPLPALLKSGSAWGPRPDPGTLFFDIMSVVRARRPDRDPGERTQPGRPPPRRHLGDDRRVPPGGRL